MDGTFWHMWSLDEIVRENEGQQSERGVLFADLLIHSLVFHLRTMADGRSQVIADALPRPTT